MIARQGRRRELQVAIAAVAIAAAAYLLGSLYPPQVLLRQWSLTRSADASAPARRMRQASLDPGIFESDQELPLGRMLGLGVKTIVLDPGHGGEDAGAVGRSGSREKDLALDISRRLRRRLEASSGLTVFLTRDRDLRLSPQERATIAHENRADIFVSIHLNFLPTKPINFIETFYFGPAPDDASADLARRENAGAGFAMNEFRSLVDRMGRRLKLEESRTLAAAVQGSLYRNSRREGVAVQDYGIKRGPFIVLNQADIPAILVEVSCLSNPEEEARLDAEEYRENIAAGLETGLTEYLRSRGGDLTPPLRSPGGTTGTNVSRP